MKNSTDIHWQKFCEIWDVIVDTNLGYRPQSYGYCDCCGDTPCLSPVECSRSEQGRCDSCGEELEQAKPPRGYSECKECDYEGL